MFAKEDNKINIQGGWKMTKHEQKTLERNSLYFQYWNRIMIKAMGALFAICFSFTAVVGGEVVVNQTFEQDKHGSHGGWARRYFSDKCSVMVTEAVASPGEGGQKSYMIQRHEDAKNGWLHMGFPRVEEPFELSVDIKVERGTESFSLSIFSDWKAFIQLNYSGGEFKNGVGRGPGNLQSITPIDPACWYRVKITVPNKISEATEYNLVVGKFDESGKLMDVKEFNNLGIFKDSKVKDPHSFVSRLKIDIAPGGEVLIDNLIIKKL
ncbi:MAG: hypothetical protein JXR78_14255 [Victivallales bacterium]|nr:hypothetical protein [Victivallales bacterium]